MNEQVTSYINEAPEEQRELMKAIRALIHEQVPDVKESFKWSRPVFSTDSDFAYFKVAKAYLTLGFFHYEKIKDNADLLEGTGKDMRHIKIKKRKDLKPQLVAKWISSLTE